MMTWTCHLIVSTYPIWPMPSVVTNLGIVSVVGIVNSNVAPQMVRRGADSKQRVGEARTSVVITTSRIDI